MSPVKRHHTQVPDTSYTTRSARLVIDLRDGCDEAELTRISNRLGVPVRWVHPLSQDEGLAVATVPDLITALTVLDGDAGVEVVEPSIPYASFSMPNDPLLPKQWNFTAIGVAYGWDQTPQGQGVIVAVLDTGVGNVEDFASDTILSGASFVPSEPDTLDVQGHGTHVAGTIAQHTNNGLGTAGIAPKAKILPVKVLASNGAGTSEGIAAGIDFAVDSGASVINLSLGGGYSKVIHLAVQKATKAGVLVVAAAGNTGQRSVSYPGALSETIGVSAIDARGRLAPYSSYGPGVDIAAPGGDTRTLGGGILQNTIVDGKGPSEYVEFQGTSMATPHVSGAAAVLLSMGVPVRTVQRVLLRTARGAGYNERVGNGVLDLKKAVQSVGVHANGAQFMYAFLLAGLLCLFTQTSIGYSIPICLGAACVSGGFFFLDWTPFDARILSQGILRWPTEFLGARFGQNPLWVSAVLPFLSAFVFGIGHRGRVLALSLNIGFGTSMVYGWATGVVVPSGLPPSVATAWVGINVAICLFLSLALLGMSRLEGSGS